MVRVGIFGLGGVADRIHLPACSAVPEIEIVGASEPVAATRERMASKFRLAHVYENARTLLVEQHPDVVIIGSPPDSHHQLCRLALEHQAHVFSEKPFMETVEQAEDVIALARSTKRYVAVNNQYRYMTLYRQTHDRLEAGEFGRLYYLQCWQQMLQPPERSKVPWRAELKRSTLFEFGTHALDLICYLVGDLPQALTASIPKVRSGHDSDVVVQLTLRFSGERLATLSMNRISHASERYLEMRLDCAEASLRLSLGGVARGSIEWSSRLGRPTARFSFVKGGEGRSESGGRSITYVREPQQAFIPATSSHLREFLRNIQQEPLDYTPVENAREILRLVSAGYESALSGETVWFNR